MSLLASRALVLRNHRDYKKLAVAIWFCQLLISYVVALS